MRRHRSPILYLIALVAISATSTRCASRESAHRSPVMYATQDLEPFFDRWQHRDGAGAFALSDYFLDFLGADPIGFIETADAHPAVLHSWLSEVADLSFRDFGACCDSASLECTRRELITVLQGANVRQEAEPTRLRILVVLENTSVTSVD